ncbi:MAG TPA: DUF3040 domain-containing protein [Actinopolymorphaceae bacterium]
MPLSDHEQRVLEQMERALAAEDPKFASSFRGAAARRHTRRRLLLAFTGILVGLAILLCAVVVEGIATRLPLQIVVGLAGFAIMLGSAYMTVTGLRPGLIAETSAAPPEPNKPAPRKSTSAGSGDSTSFMGRFEQRWHRRRDGDH